MKVLAVMSLCVFLAAIGGGIAAPQISASPETAGDAFARAAQTLPAHLEEASA